MYCCIALPNTVFERKSLLPFSQNAALYTFVISERNFSVLLRVEKKQEFSGGMVL